MDMRPRPHQNRISGIVEVDGRGYSAVALRRQDKVAESGARERSSRAWDNTDCRNRPRRISNLGSMTFGVLPRHHPVIAPASMSLLRRRAGAQKLFETTSESSPGPLPPRLYQTGICHYRPLSGGRPQLQSGIQGALRGGAEHRPEPSVGHRRTANGAPSRQKRRHQ